MKEEGILAQNAQKGRYVAQTRTHSPHRGRSPVPTDLHWTTAEESPLHLRGLSRGGNREMRAHETDDEPPLR